MAVQPRVRRVTIKVEFVGGAQHTFAQPFTNPGGQPLAVVGRAVKSLLAGVAGVTPAALELEE